MNWSRNIFWLLVKANHLGETPSPYCDVWSRFRGSPNVLGWLDEAQFGNAPDKNRANFVPATLG